MTQAANFLLSGYCASPAPATRGFSPENARLTILGGAKEWPSLFKENDGNHRSSGSRKPTEFFSSW